MNAGHHTPRAATIGTMTDTFRTQLAISTGRAAKRALKLIDPDRGTNLPGRLALGVDPSALRTMLKRIDGRVAYVSGTNGKTTTASLITACLRADGGNPASNTAGANLSTGLASALLTAGDSVDAVLEADEAALLKIVEARPPEALVLLNLSRDQLDRYGEIDALMTRWREMLDGLGPSTRLVLNADDPRVAALGWIKSPDAPPRTAVRFFGLEVEDPAPQRPPSDASWCPFCEEPLEYSRTLSIGGGDYHCTGCGWARPKPDYRLIKAKSAGFDGFELAIETPNGMDTFSLRLPGLHNASNALAACAAASELGVTLSTVAKALTESRTAYGRAEPIELDGRAVRLLLSKNPAALTGSLLMVAESERLASRTSSPAPVLFGLNDKTADGRDVSWIWDVDFAGIIGAEHPFVASGTRASSVALRLKYDGWPADSIEIERDLYPAIRAAVARTPRGTAMSALLTYTAMRELRAELVKRQLAPRIH